MTTESLVRMPQEGTKRSKVFKAITEQKIPVWETRQIARIAGLTVRETTVARANLRSGGYLPKPDSELTRLTQHTQAATVLPLVKEYRGMGLSPLEIQLAVRREKGNELSSESVHGAVVYGTKKGHLRKLSKEETSDIKRDVNILTPEEASANVIAILELRKLLLENNQPLPTNRLEWKSFIKDYVQFYELRGLPLPKLTDLNKEDINFANRLIMSKFIGNDVGFFETLRQLYIDRKEDFENLSPEVKLRLEVFARAIKQEVKERKLDLRNSFIELGLKSGKEWFYDKDSLAVKEQKFIADKIRLGKI